MNYFVFIDKKDQKSIIYIDFGWQIVNGYKNVKKFCNWTPKTEPLKESVQESVHPQ